MICEICQIVPRGVVVVMCDTKSKEMQELEKELGFLFESNINDHYNSVNC